MYVFLAHSLISGVVNKYMYIHVGEDMLILMYYTLVSLKLTALKFSDFRKRGLIFTLI